MIYYSSANSLLITIDEHENVDAPLNADTNQANINKDTITKNMAPPNSPHNLIDPAWSPHILVSRRLREANLLHSSLLAQHSTLSSSNNDDASLPLEAVVHPLAQLALPRSHCPQPPLDDGITGGASSAPVDVHLRTIDVKLNPLERCAPHRIVMPSIDATAQIRGEMDGYSGASHSEHRSVAWNAITALSSLCDEVHELEGVLATSIFPSLLLFNAGANSLPEKKNAHRLDEGAIRLRHSALLRGMGRFMPALQTASNAVARLRRLVKNMVAQLGGCRTSPSSVSFYLEGGKRDADEEMSGNHPPRGGLQPPVFGEVPLFVLGKAIGTALRLLIVMDGIVESNGDLREAWGMYKDVVMECSEEKRAANNVDAQFESFERMMIQLDYTILSSRSFLSAIHQNFDPSGRFASAGFAMHTEIHSMLSNLYGQYCECINTEHETTERLDCVGVYALYVLYRHLLPPKVVPDAKLHKNLWSVFPAMCPILELYGPLYFIPREFMMLHAPYEAVKGCSADIGEIHRGSAALVLKWDGSFKARANKIRNDALAWLAVADAELAPIAADNRHVDGEGASDDGEFNPVNSVGNIERATSCIIRGMKIAHSASITLRSQLIAHRALELDHNPEHTLSYISLIVVLKSVEKMLRVRRRTAVLAFQRATLKMIASNILKRFEGVRSFVDEYSTNDSSRTSDSARRFARISACLSALEGILKGSSSFSPIRRYSIAFTIFACMDPMLIGRFGANDMSALTGHLKDLNEISSIEEIQQKVCDCSFLYFYRDLYPSFFNGLFETSLNSSVGHTHLVLSALSDSERILKQVKHVKDSKECLAGYQNLLLHLVREKLVGPVSEVIEYHLRLACHSKNDRRQNSNANERLAPCVRAMVQSSPVYICHMKLDLKSEIEDRLAKIFYNQCAVSLSDANAYTKMRFIANERYGLNITDPYLPDGSLNQAIDLMDCMRDFESFISKFNYNMMDQTFIERKPVRGAKFLASFGAKCISASIIQHGVGIIGSAVDVCYRLLAQKFQLFTQLISNDYVKSLLAKELRWVTNHKNEGNTIYPFHRAQKFAQEVNEMGADGGSDQSSLDECRSLITSIGNIIAFVRLIRAAKRKMSSNEMPYLPTQSSTSSNAKARVEMDKLLSESLQQQDSDFVRALVDVFRGVAFQPDAASIRSLFCLVPALCLNWMDASLQGKDMMNKKNITRDGFYTDDGFAVGLTFCLLVFDQIRQYKSLNWFKSVQNKYAMDEEDLIEKESAQEVKLNAKLASKQSSWFSSGAGEDIMPDENDEITILKMMRKRLESNKCEMAVLFCNMHGAERFFKDIQSPAA